MRFTLRSATACDAEPIANVFSASFRLLTFLPMLHTVEEDRRYIENVILKECEVTVAEDENGIVAFLARQGEEVRLLHTRPDRIGMGAGTQLIDAAKASGIGALELWCFQANERARRFYEARGFRAIRFTDGAHNEEQMPDIRYQVGTIGPPSPQIFLAPPRSGGLFQRAVRDIVNAGEKMYQRAGVKLHHGGVPNAPTGRLLLCGKQNEKRIASPANVPETSSVASPSVLPLPRSILRPVPFPF